MKSGLPLKYRIQLHESSALTGLTEICGPRKVVRMITLFRISFGINTISAFQPESLPPRRSESSLTGLRF